MMMKNAPCYILGFLLAVVVSGCAKSSADSVVKDLLAAEQDNLNLGETIRAGKLDWNKMEEIGQRLVDLNAQLAAMPKEEVDAAKEKYKDEFLKLAERKKKTETMPRIKPGR
jgi:hypothetical protein